MKYNGSTFWHNLSMFPNCRMTTNNSSVYFISANQNKSIIGIPCKNSYVREEFDLEEMYIFDVTEEIPNAAYSIYGNDIYFLEQKTKTYIIEFAQSICNFKKTVIVDDDIYDSLNSIKKCDANAAPTPMKNIYSCIQCEEYFDSTINRHCIKNGQDKMLAIFNSGVYSEKFMNILRTAMQRVIDIYNSIK